jgi:hypothetical protein
MPREILRITPEVTYNQYNSGGTPIYIDLPQSDAQTVRVTQNQWITRAASSDNLRTLLGATTYDVTGKLMCYCRPQQAAVLIGYLCALTGTNCPTLPSFTMDHAIFIENGSCTPEYTRYTGCMASGGFKLDNTPQGSLMMLNLDIYGASYATGISWTTPAYSAYDYAQAPFFFEDLASGLTIAGTGRVNFESFEFNSGNNIKGFRGETANVTQRRLFGRDPSVTIKNLYQSVADRTAYNASTETALEAIFTDAAGHTLTFQFGNANYFSAILDNLNIDDFHRQTITLQNLMDPATGTDFTATYAA